MRTAAAHQSPCCLGCGMLAGVVVGRHVDRVYQCWVALQNSQGSHTEIRAENSELLQIIGPDDPQHWSPPRACIWLHPRPHT